MPNINQSVTYTANANGSPTAPITYTWAISPGTQGTDFNITTGSLNSPISLSQITVEWLTVGNYTVNVTAQNSCSTVSDPDGFSVSVTNGGGGCTPISSVSISV